MEIRLELGYFLVFFFKDVSKVKLSRTRERAFKEKYKPYM